MSNDTIKIIIRVCAGLFGAILCVPAVVFMTFMVAENPSMFPVPFMATCVIISLAGSIYTGGRFIAMAFSKEP